MAIGNRPGCRRLALLEGVRIPRFEIGKKGVRRSGAKRPRCFTRRCGGDVGLREIVADPGSVVANGDVGVADATSRIRAGIRLDANHRGVGGRGKRTNGNNAYSASHRIKLELCQFDRLTKDVFHCFAPYLGQSTPPTSENTR